MTSESGFCRRFPRTTAGNHISAREDERGQSEFQRLSRQFLGGQGKLRSQLDSSDDEPLCCFMPGGLQAAGGLPQDSLKARTSTFEVPSDQNTTKIPREDPQREENRHEKASGERKKRREDPPEREKKRMWAGEEKREILGGPAEGGPKREGSKPTLAKPTLAKVKV